MLNETKEKPFKCKFCNATFICCKNFETHSRLHRKKSLSCRLCKAVFLDWKSIKVHLWKAHSVVGSEQVKSTIVLNKRAFIKGASDNVPLLEDASHTGALTPSPTHNSEIRHSEDVEQSKSVYGCVRCNKTFKNLFSLSKHLKNHLEKGDLQLVTESTSREQSLYARDHCNIDKHVIKNKDEEANIGIRSMNTDNNKNNNETATNTNTTVSTNLEQQDPSYMESLKALSNQVSPQCWK